MKKRWLRKNKQNSFRSKSSENLNWNQKTMFNKAKKDVFYFTKNRSFYDKTLLIIAIEKKLAWWISQNMWLFIKKKKKIKEYSIHFYFCFKISPTRFEYFDLCTRFCCVNIIYSLLLLVFDRIRPVLSGFILNQIQESHSRNITKI